MPVRILIADDHPPVLRGLSSLFGFAEDFEVVASCSNGTECLIVIRKLRPDIALLGMTMPDLNGIEILEAVETEHLDTRIVFLSAAIGDWQHRAAPFRGAPGTLFKDSPPIVLLDHLREIATRRNSLSGWQLDKALRGAIDPTARESSNCTAPTHREREVMILVSEGLANKQIAQRLDVSEGTVKVHLHNIFQKTGIINRTALAKHVVGLRRNIA